MICLGLMIPVAWVTFRLLLPLPYFVFVCFVFLCFHFQRGWSFSQTHLQIDSIFLPHAQQPAPGTDSRDRQLFFIFLEGRSECLDGRRVGWGCKLAI